MIEKTVNASCVVVWDKNDDLLGVEKQLNDRKVYGDVSNTKNILNKLSEAISKMFSSLKPEDFLIEKKMKYFKYKFEKAVIFRRLYVLPKILKRLHNVIKKAS